MMESVTVQNFRCFRDAQTARMAPLTFLVGENSTGKTSFLALLRALWDVAIREVAPDFRETPYDLGSFEDIAYSPGRDGSYGADSFKAGLGYQRHIVDKENLPSRKIIFQAVFKERKGVPFPIMRSVTSDDAWVEAHSLESGGYTVKFGTADKKWENTIDPHFARYDKIIGLYDLVTFWRFFVQDGYLVSGGVISGDELQPVLDLLNLIDPAGYPYAGAPVRSSPKRTYDHIRESRDPEGDDIPTYLANISRRNPEEWKTLKSNLEEFGQQSGLFDEIKINSFGNTASSPFQLHIGKGSSGFTRNLIDVGYGVSQALPLITALYSPEPIPLFLLQQPEVHLHPSAQAALGSLFCSIASPQRQLVVETHSDYIIDRVLMDIRDAKTELKPEDVSILYFERNDLDVTIHSLRIDDRATIIDPPDSYRQFFMNELRRSVGL